VPVTFAVYYAPGEFDEAMAQGIVVQLACRQVPRQDIMQHNARHGGGNEARVKRAEQLTGTAGGKGRRHSAVRTQWRRR
jgi:hypothetical protein